MCKLLAKYLLGGEQRMIRVDMSEFMEPHSVSKLIGSPPGYVGHDDGNKLLEKVRKNPYSLVLFDEIEKAHPQVLDILLQILDEGHLTDSRGRDINFKNTIIVMTSNLGTDVLKTNSIGFGGSQTDRYDEIKSEAIKSLKPEFVNRIDEISIFNQLTPKDLKGIVALQFKVFAARVKKNYKINVKYTSDVIDSLTSSDQVTKYGAREIKRDFRKHIENNLAELLVNNKAGKSDIEVYLDGGIIKFREL
jgi:ATP-dependent Clp protease ATP-binding subunit ClpC